MGTFIVFEGGEGSGKSTVITEVARHLENVVVTREPGGSPYAEEIRRLILSDTAAHADAETLFMLFWAARRDHLVQTIIPALQAGKTVLSDRFDCSTYAYQLVGQQQEQLADLFWKIRDHVLGECIPDAYIVLDIDPAIGLERIRARGEKQNHLDLKNIEFHSRVREALKEFVTTHTKHGEVVDASQPLKEVVAQTLHKVQQYTHAAK